MNNNGMQNGFQQPMFAPVTQGNKFGDDIDLSDIFAEYLNDGTADPLTTFSNFGGMGGNFGSVQTIPVAQAPAASSVLLPTGGIRTAFHSGALPNVQQQQQQQIQQQEQIQQQQQIQQQEQFQQQQQQLQQQQQQQQQLLQQSFQQPLQKKPRVEGINQFQAFQQQAAVPSNVSTTGSGITGRLGLNLMGGQVTMPNASQPAPAQGLAPGQVQLPIGVGIRVGGALPQTNIAAGNGMNQGQLGARAGAPVIGNTAQLPMWTGNATGGLSDQAMAERRQRNREHAKRSRVRKKFLLESLQAEVKELQVENEGLRMIIQSKIPQHAQRIISECCTKNPLFDDSAVDETMGDEDPDKEAAEKKKTELVNSDFSLIKSLTSGQQNFVLSDPRLPDNPIVYASDGFYQLTGYTREQVLGRNCRFLQGPGTDPKAVDVIRTAVANGTDATACLLNYKADGTPFWNQFFVAALRDSDNCIVNYVGVQCAVDPQAGASALEDKVNSILPLAHKQGEP
jgi:PAS domain S-box-containing protein